jgi:hypothetical protein
MRAQPFGNLIGKQNIRRSPNQRDEYRKRPRITVRHWPSMDVQYDRKYRSEPASQSSAIAPAIIIISAILDPHYFTVNAFDNFFFTAS